MTEGISNGVHLQHSERKKLMNTDTPTTRALCLNSPTSTISDLSYSEIDQSTFANFTFVAEKKKCTLPTSIPPRHLMQEFGGSIGSMSGPSNPTPLRQRLGADATISDSYVATSGSDQSPTPSLGSHLLLELSPNESATSGSFSYDDCESDVTDESFEIKNSNLNASKDIMTSPLNTNLSLLIDELERDLDSFNLNEKKKQTRDSIGSAQALLRRARERRKSILSPTRTLDYKR